MRRNCLRTRKQVFFGLYYESTSGFQWKRLLLTVSVNLSFYVLAYIHHDGTLGFFRTDRYLA
jgi:hypothetical protein